MARDDDPLFGYTEVDRAFLAAVPIEYRPIAEVMRQASTDSGERVSRHMRWEKHAVTGAIDVDLKNRRTVMVRRGHAWKPHWDDEGVETTKRQLNSHSEVDEIERLMREMGFDGELDPTPGRPRRR